MLRSGFLLSMSGPAALLALMVHPVVRSAADQMSGPVATLSAPAALPGMRPELLGLSPYRTAVAVRPSKASEPAIAEQIAPLPVQKPALQPRRMMREGCEGAISSLAGPEARRMVPGRCIA